MITKALSGLNSSMRHKDGASGKMQTNVQLFVDQEECFSDVSAEHPQGNACQKVSHIIVYHLIHIIT